MSDAPLYIGRLLYNDKVIGTAFLVNKSGFIATCYHVLAAALGDAPAGKSLQFQFLHTTHVYQIVVTDKFDAVNDVALLRLLEPLPRKLQVARLVSSDQAKPGMVFRITGFGKLEDAGHVYEYLSASGSVVGTVGRDGNSLLQLDSKQILPGMSGAPVVIEELGGVVGIISARYSIDPTKQTWMRDTGWAAKVERLIALDNQSLHILPPLVPQKSSLLERVTKYLPVLLIPVLLSILGIVFLLINSRIPPLENAPFNIALAGFTIDPSSGISAADAEVLSEAFFTSFNTRIDQLQAELPFVVSVWSPDQIGIITGDTPEQREQNAQVLVGRIKEEQNARADIIVYGIITLQNGRVAVLPEFLIVENWPELSEVFGRFELTAALTTPGINQIRALSNELTSRSQVLALITQGIIEMILQDYGNARAAFEQGLEINRTNSLGQELFYILMGNASLGNYSQLIVTGAAGSTENLDPFLEQAEVDFRNAIDVNPEYSRAYAGLGSVLYLQAIADVAPQQRWSEISEEQLSNIQSMYELALAASDQPETADVPTKVAFGLGQLYLLRYLAGDEGAWENARVEFSHIIADYESGQNLRIREFAAQASGLVGRLYLARNMFDLARENYNRAIELTELDARRLAFSRSVAEVSYVQHRANGEINAAAEDIDAILELDLSPADSARWLYQKAKMFSESGREVDAISSYEQALTYNLGDEPVLAAQIWVELGDLYYDEQRLQDSINAYQQALQIDPDNQSHLTRVIDETTSELEASETTDEPIEGASEATPFPGP